MEITARVTKLENSESNLKGLASVNFGNVMDVRSIQVVEGRDGQLFVAMPSYKTKQLDENGKNKYSDYCNPITKEFREQLYAAILDSYDSGKAVTFEDGKDMKLDIKTRNITDMGNLKGSAQIYIDDGFVINNIAIREGKNGNLYTSMPSYKTNKTTDDGHAVYQDIAYAHTDQLKHQLSDSVLKKFNENSTLGFNPFEKNDSIVVHAESEALSEDAAGHDGADPPVKGTNESKNQSKTEKPKGIAAKLAEGKRKVAEEKAATPIAANTKSKGAQLALG